MANKLDKMKTITPTMRDILVYFAKKYKDDWDEIMNALATKEKVSTLDLEEVLGELKDIKVITIIDEDYPQQYKSVHKPPFVIWISSGIVN